MKLFLMMVLSTLSMSAMAQVNTYTFQTEAGQPWALSQYPDAVITNHTFLEGLVFPAKIKIPFPFTYNGQIQDSVGISENGFVWFGSAQASEMRSVVFPIGEPLSNSVTGIVSAFGGDLQPTTMNGTATELQSGIVGNDPMKILIIEWKNISRKETVGAETAPDTISFQLKLYQFMNRIEIAYLHAGLNTDFLSGVQVGLRGVDAADFNLRTTETPGTNWTTTTQATTNSAMCEVSQTHHPLYGDMFVWMPSQSTGISEHVQTALAVYPNPATDRVTIELSNEYETVVKLFDLTGKIIEQQTARGTHELSLIGLNQGMYIIQTENPHQTSHVQMAVVK